MSVESAWDEALAKAGGMLDSEHQAYIAQAHAMGKEIERLRAEVEALRATAERLRARVTS